MDFQDCKEVSLAELMSTVKYRSCKMKPYPEYVCDCMSNATGRCDDAKVGAENISGTFGGRGLNSTSRNTSSMAASAQMMRALGLSGAFYSNFSHWGGNLARKLGGTWYSTHKAGKCSDKNYAEQQRHGDCSWRVVKTVKRVSKRCADASLYAYIEAKDRNSCFSSCRKPTDGSPRNMSDECWVGCLYTTVLGRRAGSEDLTFSASDGSAEEGLSMRELEEAWERPFLSSNAADGGCPAISRTSPTATTGQGSPKSSSPGSSLWVTLVMAAVVSLACTVAMCWLLLCKKMVAPGSATGKWIETDVRGNALSEKILS